MALTALAVEAPQSVMLRSYPEHPIRIFLNHVHYLRALWRIGWMIPLPGQSIVGNQSVPIDTDPQPAVPNPGEGNHIV